MAGSTKRFWLVRHGLTTWNAQKRFIGHSDIPLSAKGRAQADWLARQLRHRPITTIYTSDLVRARETARIIAAQRTPELPVRVSPAWRELNFGEWEGLTYAQIAARYEGSSRFFSDPEHSAPTGGEALAHMLQRVRAELASIARNLNWSSGGDVVIVSHSGVLRVLLCDLLSIPLAHQWQLRIDAGSLSALDVSLQPDTETLLATLVLLNMHRTATRL